MHIPPLKEDAESNFDNRVMPVEEEAAMVEDSVSLDESRAMELAIVGMAGRFPGAANIETFWQNLCNGVESISSFSDEEVEATGVDPQLMKDPHYVKAGGVLEDVENFDASFFSIYPREAAIMDPQHRVFLEVAWEALENAGYNPETYPGWIGLFGGTGMNTYLMYNLLPNREIMDTVHGYQLTISNDKDFLTTRVSYKLNLRGPSVNVQTACSTSLVAVHLACQSLLSYQCDMALAGGVSIRQPQKTGYLYQEGGITSPDGHCRAFDAEAAGTVSGHGAGIVVIKRLIDAIKDGDTIRAIIKGSAMNNDGSLKVGYTAPSIEGQVEVISMAQAIANVDPSTITYIETHGTGTALGDPIEIAALAQVFRERGAQPRKFCAIGSVKTNVGHLDAAAGVTSLIKTVLALENRLIPPSLNFTRPNPKIDFENSPFYVNTQLRAWLPEGTPRRAGISSFGIGGTNVHMILEEAAALEGTRNDEPPERRPWKLLLLSARSSMALEKATDNLANYFNQYLKRKATSNVADLSLADVAYTLQVGRKAFSQRRMLVCKDVQEAKLALESRDPQSVFTQLQRENGAQRTGEIHGQVAFMFSGQGAQYVNMALGLYETEAIFREQIDRCAEILNSGPVALGQDIRDLIFDKQNNLNTIVPASGDGEGEASDLDPAAQALMQTGFTQPALFVVEYALARLLMHWGIVPQAMIGHSIGEYVAACLAGVISLDDALKLVAARGRLMQALEAGSMLSIPLSEAEVRPYLRKGISLAAVNAPSLCVVSGRKESIDALTYRLANDAVEYRRLRTSHAFHSEMMDPILEEFQQQFAGVTLSAPSIPILSNVSGTWMTEEQATDPGYWARHLRQTVRFCDGVSELLKDPAWVLLEIGPGQTLTSLAKSVLSAWAASGPRPVEDRVILSTLRPPRSRQPDQAFLLNTLGRLWLTGIDINWTEYHVSMRLSTTGQNGERRRLPLPSYPFDRKRYWVEPDMPLGRLLSGGGDNRLSAVDYNRATRLSTPMRPNATVKRPQIRDWFYMPSWKRSSLVQPVSPGRNQQGEIQPVRLSTTRWLIFDGGEGVSFTSSVDLGGLLPAGSELIQVNSASTFERVNENHYRINPAHPEGYDLLFKDLADKGRLPDTIVNLWNLVNLDAFVEQEEVVQQTGFEGRVQFQSLLNLVQALDRQKITQAVQVGVVTNGAYEVTGDENLHPGQAALTALCKIVTQEYPNLICRIIDLNDREAEDWDAKAVGLIVSEMRHQAKERFVAYRGPHRWVQVFEPVDGEESGDSLLRQGGVYMITGGLGRIGLTLAQYLARKTQANLVLVDRFDFPAQSDWDSFLADSIEYNPVDYNQVGGEQQASDVPEATARNDTRLSVVEYNRTTQLNSTIRQRILRLKEIEAIGARVLVLKADVSVLDEMQAVFDGIIARFGALNGIIHAAGVVGEAAIKPLFETHTQEIETQFRPKVVGLQVLHEILQENTRLVQSGKTDSVEVNGKAIPNQVILDQLDFVFLQSSLSTVLGGLGMGAYAAANSAMDHYATIYNQSGSLPWISVDWDGWRFGEMGQKDSPAGLFELKRMTATDMDPEEGVQVFNLAMHHAAHGARHLVVSTIDLQARLDRWVVNIAASWPGGSDIDTGLPIPGITSVELIGKLNSSDMTGRTQAGSGFARPNLQTTYVSPRDDLEAQVVEAWQKILGISPIGVYDDFFELGGHSLLATQLVTRLRDTFKVELPLSRLFEAPTVAGLVGLIGESMQSQRIPRVPRDGNLSLSFGQQRLWFIDQLEPGSPLYNNFAALRLSGDLDREALEFCMNKIIQRHESLRTTFRDVKGQPVQVIHESMAMPMEELALPDQIVADGLSQTDEITRLAIEEAGKPFDLAQGPLMRLALLQTGPQEHVIFLTMHHIVSDGWSVGVMISEVGALYAAYMAAKSGQKINLETVLPELPIQYADYAAWQRQWLQGERLEAQLEYWKKQLQGSQNLELFTDFPRSAVQTWHGANRWFELPETLSNALVELSQKEGTTLFMTLLAALQVLLARYSGQEDISVGTPIANRTRAEAESLIGFVLNTLVMRTDLTGDPTFRELLGRVREMALGAYAHQDLPFETLVETLQPARDMSRAPFFQVMFDLQAAPLQALKLPGMTITPIPIDSGAAKFDLALSMEETTLEAVGQNKKGHTLKGYLNYNTDLFEAGTIERMLGHFIVLLDGIIAAPDQRLSQLSLLSSAEKNQLLTEWNSNPVGYEQVTSEPRVSFIHEMIHRQALLSPTAPALSVASGREQNAPSLSYQELDERSSQLANYLVRLGVGPETLVGLCMERSFDMIIGLLGILKAGGAFLPLDPTYPQERLSFMLEDSRAPVVLTQAALLNVNPGLAELFDPEKRTGSTDELYSTIKIVKVDQEASKFSELARTIPKIGLSGENMAYLIYTSGSTGKPKGVMISHQSVADHCRDMAIHFQIQASDRELQFASLNFDAGLEQVFTALMSGAWLFLRGDDVWEAAEFHQKINEFGLTVVNVPPAYWRPWVQYVAELESKSLEELNSRGGSDQIQSAPTLRLVIIGGDVMLMDTLEQWWQTSLRRVRLLNAYGPTETTITATTYQVPDHTVDSLAGSHYARIPIGKPHPNRTAYVLDRHGNLVPIGVPGELHLGGAYLARGYLNQPEMTAEKFIADIFQPGGRLYKTGDLVRRLPDGTIDFVGRVDQQIKLRGFRIELGEIEAAIGAHPLVDEVCVAVVEHQQKRLAAYVVVADKELPGDLFDFVSEKLPSYMVPAVFVKMESLPLMPSGKVDRQALAEMPLPEQGVLVGADRTVVRNRVPPRSPLEQEIMDLWTEILEIPTTRLSAVEYNRVEYNRTTPLSTTKDPPPIGIYDNFFELGGHSLLATQVVSRLREDYQVELPLRQLFEKPTIAGIASLIAQSLVEEETEEDLDALLADLEHMSEDEVRQSLQMSAVEYNRTTGLSTTNFNPNGSDNVPEGQQE